MNTYAPYGILALLAYVVMCHPLEANDTRLANRADIRELERQENGYPPDTTIEDAIAHLTNVTLVAEYRGPMAGSDQFMITMPDGRKVSNWQIRTVFSFVLEPFGKESIPFLIDLLNHKYEYVRWGAYYILTSKSGRYDGRFYHSKTEEERVAIVSDWRLWWEEYNDHFSLDSSQRSRTYEATEWERVYGKDSNQTMEPTGDTRAADFD